MNIKTLFISFIFLINLGFCQNDNTMDQTIYQFKVKDIEGKTFDFENLRGKKIMIVNTASKCGLTGQYKGLQKLYDRYKNSGFVIVGFPANDFLWQEPGSNKEIAAFCEKNYGVTFPMMSKITVKGNEMHPLYQFLTQVRKNGYKSSTVSWNFQKYLIGTDGKLSKIITPRTAPMSEEVVNWVEEDVMAVNESL
ncbi:glutathione peroxidase [Flavobacteriaceae bacterium]|nr:glutathione peroxidase [Flavobacteriaceae bacterium]MDB2314817.1 glutathione peroxidase [Flavobacteriaceae bacterium]MDC0478840.1 glutathione peroxidase [Flavobacteriaceae bacterium]MDC3238280.1 glutathione peroxidase [Flavobacteriaceae bacterium]